MYRNSKSLRRQNTVIHVVTVFCLFKSEESQYMLKALPEMCLLNIEITYYKNDIDILLQFVYNSNKIQIINDTHIIEKSIVLKQKMC